MSIAFIKLEVNLPDELIKDFLQYIRDYDNEHSEEFKCNILVKSELGTDATETILNSLIPPFPYITKHTLQ